MKLNSFCATEETVYQIVPTEWESIFTSHTSERELISNIHKELRNLNTKNAKQPRFSIISHWGNVKVHPDSLSP